MLSTHFSPFLYPLKKSENQRPSDYFKGGGGKDMEHWANKDTTKNDFITSCLSTHVFQVSFGIFARSCLLNPREDILKTSFFQAHLEVLHLEH